MGTKALETDPTVVLTLASDLTVTSVTDCCVVIYAGTLNTAATLTTTSENYCAVQGSGNNNGTVINITGGAITAADVAIYHPQNGTLNISGGTITGETGVYVKAGTVNITGGKIVATGTVAEAYDENNDGCPSTGDALVVENPGDGYGGVAPVVSVTGGDFSSVAGANVATYAAAEKTVVTDIVSGGTFNKALSEDVCAEGFVVEDVDGDGKFDANPENAVAYIGGVGYATLAEAVAAAQAGDTIKLIANVTTGTITVNKSITIEGALIGDVYPSICYTASKVFSLANTTLTFNLKNVNIAGDENSPNSNFIYITAGAVATININNVAFTAGEESTASGIIYSANAQVTIVANNFTLAAGAALFNAPNTPAATDFVKITLTNCDLGTRPVVNSAAMAPFTFADDAAAKAANVVVRIGAAGEDAKYFACAKAAITAAGNNDTIYLLTNQTISSAVAIKGKSITIASADATARVTLTLRGNDVVQLYEGAALTFADIIIDANGRRVRVYVTDAEDALPVLTFAKGATLTTGNLTGWTNDNVLYSNVAAKFVLAEGAEWIFKASNTSGSKFPVYSAGALTLEIAGSIVYDVSTVNSDYKAQYARSPIGIVYAPNGSTVTIASTATISYNADPLSAASAFYFDATVTMNGFNDAAAEAYAINAGLVRINNTNTYYTSLYAAYQNAQAGDTIYIMGANNAIRSSVTFNKKVTIAGYGTEKVQLTSGATIPFYFNNGADVTFKNLDIFFPFTRFGRLDGAVTAITFESTDIYTRNASNISWPKNATQYDGDGNFIYSNKDSGDATKKFTITLDENSSFTREAGWKDGKESPTGYFVSLSNGSQIVAGSAIHIKGAFNSVSTNSGNIFRDTANENGGSNVEIHLYTTSNIGTLGGGLGYSCGLTYFHGMTLDQAMALAIKGGYHALAVSGEDMFANYLNKAQFVTAFVNKLANNSVVHMRSLSTVSIIVAEKAVTFRGWSADGSIPTLDRGGSGDQFVVSNNGTITLENMIYKTTARNFRFSNASTDANTKFVLGDNFTIKMSSWGTEDLFHAGMNGMPVSTTLEMKPTATIDITANDANGIHRLFYLPATANLELAGTIKLNWTATNAAGYLMGVGNFVGTINIYDTAVFDINITGGQQEYAGAKCHQFFRQTNQEQQINIYGGTFTWTGAGTFFLSNSAANHLNITGGTFTHNGDGSGENRESTVIFYRSAGSESLYNISNATLIAKGNAYIFEQGYGIGMVKNCTISSERAEIIYNAEGGWGTFVNVKVAPATDADRLVIAAGIPFAGRLGYANDGVVDGVIYAGNGSGFNFGLALTAVADAGLEGPVYLMADMDVATSINLNGGSINLAGNNLGTVDAPIYPTITAAVDLFTLSAGDTIVLTNLNLVLSGNRGFYIPAAMASAADITLNNLNVTGSANLVASANVAMSFNLTIDGGRYVLVDPAADSNKGFLFNDATAAEKESINFIISDAYLQCGIIRSRNTEVLSADLDNVTIDVSPKAIFMPYGKGTWTIEINDSNISTAASSLVYNPDDALVILNAYDSEFTITAPTSLYGSFYYGTATTNYAAKLQSTMNNVKITVGGSSASVVYTNSTVAEIDLDWTNVTATSTYRILEILNAGTKAKHHFKLTGCNFVSTSYTINIQHKTESATKDHVFVEIYDSYMQSKIEVLRFTDVAGAYFKCVDSTFNCTGTMCVASNTNGMPYMDFYGCKIYGGGTNYAVRLYGKKGAYANFYDTYIYGNGTANAPLAGGNAIVYNFYSGWIDTKASQSAFNALSADVVINFWGGTVNVLPSTGGAVAYTTSTGKVNVYGGQFYSNNTASALFYNASPTKDLTVGAYVAQGLAELCVNAGTGLPSAAFDKNGVSTFNAPRMTAGATPVVTTNGVGLGFLGTVSAATKAYLETHADVVTPAVEDPANPENNTPAVYAISYGMLIVNYEAIKNDPEALRYLTHYGMKAYFNESEVPYVIDLNEETVAAMQAEGIDVALEIVNEDDGCVSVKVTLPAGLSEKYGAIVYARSEVNDGAPVYSYSAFSVAENVRNLEQVLRSAYNDLSATQTEFYVNAVTVGEVTLYSHFTVDERAAMAELLGADTDRKALDLYIVAGGSNTVGHAPFGADFADDFYASTNLNNVFVSGAMAQNAQLNLGSGAVKDIIAAKYISAGTAAGLGLGWTSDVLGFEAGLASALAEQYSDENGKYAAIFKYGFEDLAIADLTADGSAIYALFIAALMENVAMYEEQGFDVNIVGLYWAQGEADASEDNVLTTYPAQFNTLIADLKADLAVAELPVAVAEISIYTAAGTTIADNEAFVEMQNALENVTIVEIAELLTDNGLYFDPTEVILAGEIAASILYNTTVEEADQIEVPKADPMMQILDADGQPFLNEDGEPVGYRSLAIAIAKLPEGCSIQLTSDITLYAALNVINANGAVVDGNGKTITVKASSGSGMVFESSKIEFQNLNIVHTGTEAGTYAIEIGGRSRVTISGNSNLTAEKTVIRMDGVGSTLILKDATVTSRNEDCAATDALIYTTNSNLMVDGGTLNAAGEAACVYIDAAAPEKLAVNIKAGTFNSNATCFINKSIVAIMVAAPGVTVNAPVAFENAGFGNK